MVRQIRVLFAVAALGIVVGACGSVSPTASPAAPSASQASPSGSPTTTARPTIVGPAWVLQAADRWDPGSPQWNALAQPDVPYRLGGSAFGNSNSVTFTPTQARLWWDYWFTHPVDIAGVSPGLLPGNLVLSPEELKRATLLTGRGSTLPKAPRDYNPLGLIVIP